MRRDIRKYLYDILKAADIIRGFLHGKNFGDYEADILLRSGVERQFQIIGEALTQMARVDPALATRISEYRQIVGFRNILVHAYAEVDDRVVWSIALTELDSLYCEVEALLAES